jgi:HEPN domain-containing protein
MNADDPLAWFEKGDRDYALAHDMLPNQDSYPDLICYHCQQSAEKHLKSIIVHSGIKMKRTHDLEELLDLIADSGIVVSVDDYNNAIKINDYSISTRYPGSGIDPSEQDVIDAIEIAEYFREFAIRELGIKK